MASFDDEAKAVPGVKQVVQISRGVAVVADNTWSAMEGRRALKVQWDEGPNANLISAAISKLFADRAQKPGAVARRRRCRRGAGQRREENRSRLRSPFLSHATMEPMNCTADVRPDSCDVWASHANPERGQGARPRSPVFRRKRSTSTRIFWAAASDAAARRFRVRSRRDLESHRGSGEAYLVARRRHAARHLPARSYASSPAGWTDGWPVAWTSAWSARRLADCATASTVPASKASRSGLRDPEHHVDYHRTEVGIPVAYWRAVGYSQNTFFVESFMDELAVAGGKDPVELRRRLLAKSPRLLGVLELAAEKSGWGKPLPAGHSAASRW